MSTMSQCMECVPNMSSISGYGMHRNSMRNRKVELILWIFIIFLLIVIGLLTYSHLQLLMAFNNGKFIFRLVMVLNKFNFCNVYLKTHHMQKMKYQELCSPLLWFIELHKSRKDSVKMLIEERAGQAIKQTELSSSVCIHINIYILKLTDIF